jgi:hypothetical protein
MPDQITEQKKLVQRLTQEHGLTDRQVLNLLDVIEKFGVSFSNIVIDDGECGCVCDCKDCK